MKPDPVDDHLSFILLLIALALLINFVAAPIYHQFLHS
jgi:hypothetical protein